MGCGTGVIARALAKRCDIKERITAIDISAHLVEMGARLASKEGVADKIDFLVGDAHSIVEPQGRFDVVIMHTLLSHVVDPATVLREAQRLLRPDGRVVVFDGDFESLTYATDAPDGGAGTDRLLGVSGHTQGRVMRMMPRLFNETAFGSSGLGPMSPPISAEPISGPPAFPRFARCCRKPVSCRSRKRTSMWTSSNARRRTDSSLPPATSIQLSGGASTNEHGASSGRRL